MKKTLVLLVAVGWMGTVAAKADQFDVKTSTAPVKTKKVTTAKPVRAHFYITSVPATGSHLPIVVTRYGNDVHANSSLIAYSQPQLDQTGQLNVGAQLVQRDPAIMSGRSIR